MGEKKGIMLYCKKMEHLYWSDWSKKINDSNLIGPVIALLEGAGPVKYVLSQGLFAVLPFIHSSASPSLKAFAEMLENPTDARSFTDYLREETL